MPYEINQTFYSSHFDKWAIISLLHILRLVLSIIDIVDLCLRLVCFSFSYKYLFSFLGKCDKEYNYKIPKSIIKSIIKI